MYLFLTAGRRGRGVVKSRMAFECWISRDLVKMKTVLPRGRKEGRLHGDGDEEMVRE